MLNFLKDLFNRQEIANNLPVLHELIQRTDAEKHGYEVWKLNDHKDYLTGFLSRQFETWQQGKTPDADNLLLLNTPKSKGFMFAYQPAQATAAEFKYLFDYLKEKVMQFNYKVYVSDVKHFARKNHVETVERHYLKPRFTIPAEGECINQLYGNITIELLLHNEQPLHIKFVCQPYTDYKYNAALPFEALLSGILA